MQPYEYGHPYSKFLSTPSARRATHIASIRSYSFAISIHALREEGDVLRFSPRCPTMTFLSTPSARRATLSTGASCTARSFLSTPSARRATLTPSSPALPPTHFYPRPPRGGRRAPRHRCGRIPRFLSTPSARRATSWMVCPSGMMIAISIHALREEGDGLLGRPRHCPAYFYPRPPRGGRLAQGKPCQL